MDCAAAAKFDLTILRTSLLSRHVSSFVSTQPAPVEATRRRLSARQAATVARLSDAALDELRTGDFESLTMRNVAARAGVSPATAYTYFSSKEHLVSEVFWRRLADLAPVETAAERDPAQRVATALSEIALLVADEPVLAAAVSVAMLSSDPDVKLLRDRIGAATHRRIVAALGNDANPAIVRTLDLVVAGAMLNAGMGHLDYDDLPDLFAEVAATVLGTD